MSEMITWEGNYKEIVVPKPKIVEKQVSYRRWWGGTGLKTEYWIDLGMGSVGPFDNENDAYAMLAHSRRFHRAN